MSEDKRVQAIENPKPSVIAYYSAATDSWVQLTQESYDRQIAHYLNMVDLRDKVSALLAEHDKSRAEINAKYDGESK